METQVIVEQVELDGNSGTDGAMMEQVELMVIVEPTDKWKMVQVELMVIVEPTDKWKRSTWKRWNKWCRR